MYKKISIAIMVVLFVLCIIFISSNISLKKKNNELEKTVEEYKKAVIGGNENETLPTGIKELFEDIESIKEHGEPFNAKRIGTEKNRYTGNGYYIDRYEGGELIDYIAYYNGEKVWNYKMFNPLTTE